MVGFVDDTQGRQISYYTKAQYQAKEKKIHKGPQHMAHYGLVC